MLRIYNNLHRVRVCNAKPYLASIVLTRLTSRVCQLKMFSLGPWLNTNYHQQHTTPPQLLFKGSRDRKRLRFGIESFFGHTLLSIPLPFDSIPPAQHNPSLFKGPRTSRVPRFATQASFKLRNLTRRERNKCAWIICLIVTHLALPDIERTKFQINFFWTMKKKLRTNVRLNINSKSYQAEHCTVDMGLTLKLFHPWLRKTSVTHKIHPFTKVSNVLIAQQNISPSLINFQHFIFNVSLITRAKVSTAIVTW